MAVTEPADLAFPGGNRDTEETAVTNEMASEPGFPARKEDGTLVLIVNQYPEGTDKVLEDADGNKYVDDHVTGHLVDYDASKEAAVAAPEAQTEDFETTMDRFGASEPGETFGGEAVDTTEVAGVDTAPDQAA